MICVRGVPGVSGTFGKANSHFDPNPNGVGDHSITLRRLLIDAAQFCSLYMNILYTLQVWKRKRLKNNGFHIPGYTEKIGLVMLTIGRLHARDQTSSKCAFEKSG